MAMADRTRTPGLIRQRRESGTDDTLQGFFVAGADGTSYGWDNDFRPEGMLRFLNRGIKAFHDRLPKQVTTFTGGRPIAAQVGPPPGAPFSNRSTVENACNRSPYPKTKSWS